MMLGIFGACMFYGDAVITPAMSVISAVEGLEIATPKLAPYVLPITIVILIMLFWIQRRGTAVVGRLFGPIMVVWFVTLAVLGVVSYRARAARDHRAQSRTTRSRSWRSTCCRRTSCSARSCWC